MASVYRAANKNFTIATGVPEKITMPFGSKEHLFQVTPDATWEFAFTEASLLADEGIQMKSGAVYMIDSPVVQQVIFIRQSSGSDKDLRWAYLYPGVR